MAVAALLSGEALMPLLAGGAGICAAAAFIASSNGEMKQGEFAIADRVEVRDGEGEPWRHGIIVSLWPIMVKVDGREEGLNFNLIRKEGSSDDGRETKEGLAEASGTAAGGAPARKEPRPEAGAIFVSDYSFLRCLSELAQFRLERCGTLAGLQLGIARSGPDPALVARGEELRSRPAVRARGALCACAVDGRPRASRRGREARCERSELVFSASLEGVEEASSFSVQLLGSREVGCAPGAWPGQPVAGGQLLYSACASPAEQGAARASGARQGQPGAGGGSRRLRQVAALGGVRTLTNWRLRPYAAAPPRRCRCPRSAPASPR
ncbi:unnamed protein product [Prorocentrum cordatum]|uniref:Uncharacterized protein n=1 Tax=Prorocentrum cordatum TaxID=2364126 RepID=A0ABN9XUZ1_9DINO|nr:unnamed protein product [Polarella glacialis]